MEKILNNTIVEPENKCEALPEYFKCIKSLVSYCHNNPNELNTDGKDFLSLLDGRSKQYIASKKSILKKFFQTLAKHAIFRHFCQLKLDPDFENREIPLFFSTFRGPKNEEKKYLLNQIMFWFLTSGVSSRSWRFTSSPLSSSPTAQSQCKPQSETREEREISGVRRGIKL